MIPLLRHFSISLWVSGLVSLPLSLYLISLAGPAWDGAIPGILAGLVVALFFGLTSVSFHHAGKKMVLSNVREGEIWEQAGMGEKAGKSYLSALRIYDSFLLFPPAGRSLGKRLVHALARFSLESGAAENLLPGSHVHRYLRSNPRDNVMAKFWLGRFSKNNMGAGVEKGLEQAFGLLTLLARVHQDNDGMLPLLADAFVSLGRTDYWARSLYEKVLNHPELKAVYEQPVADLQGAPHRSGTGKEQGLEAFRPLTLDRPFEGEPPLPVVPESHPGEKTRRIDIQGPAVRGAQGILKALAGFPGGLKSLGKWGLHGLCLLKDLILKYLALIREKESLATHIRMGAMGLLTLFVLIFMVNTLFHLQVPLSSRKDPRKAESDVPKPFTIQVAAYLKQSHADRYVAILKTKGIDAIVKKTEAGGKTWYLVRVSEFRNKTLAADFGNRLKEEKIIDEFFVSNK